MAIEIPFGDTSLNSKSKLSIAQKSALKITQSALNLLAQQPKRDIQDKVPKLADENLETELNDWNLPVLKNGGFEGNLKGITHFKINILENKKANTNINFIIETANKKKFTMNITGTDTYNFDVNITPPVPDTMVGKVTSRDFFANIVNIGSYGGFLRNMLEMTKVK